MKTKPHTVLRPILFAFLLGLALLPGAFNASAASAAPPELMSYQGYLVDVNGAALAPSSPANYPIVFRIYNASTGGSILWSEQQIVTVDKGNFSVMLGEGTAVSGEARPALSSAFVGADASDRYLGITVTISGTTMTISPRLRLLPSPYAFYATKAQSVEFGGASIVADGPTSRLTLNPSGGNVGIGTTAPGATLEVNGGIRARGGAPGVQGANNNGYAFAGSNGDNDSGLFSSADGQIEFYGNGAERMRITSNGYVGIATTSPTTLLQIGQGANAGYGGLKINTGWANASDPTEARPFEVQFRGEPRLVLNTQGYVGIGTSTPVSLLEISHNGTSAYGVAATLKAPNKDDGARLVFDRVGIKAWGIGIHQGVNNSTFGIFEDNHSTGGFGNARLAITAGGNVGIGTTAPAAKLHVNGSMRIEVQNTIEFGSGLPKEVSNGKIGYQTFSSGLDIVGAGGDMANRRITFHAQGGIQVNGAFNINGALFRNGGYGYLAGNGSVGTASGNIPYSILSDNRIGCPEFNAFSDERIKSVIGLSDGRRDLETVQKLRVTDYRMVDTVADGDSVKKGFIAQEVETVIPEAVSLSSQYLPDIYSKALSYKFDETNQTLQLALPKAHGLKAGDQVKIVTEAGDGRLEFEVTEVRSASEFVVGKVRTDPKQAFVYGKKVADFRTLNYDRLFTTGIGAIQELARQVEELKRSEARVVELEKKAAKVDALEQQVAKLQKLVMDLAAASGKAGVPVAAVAADEKPLVSVSQ